MRNTLKIKWSRLLITLFVGILAACATEGVKPILGDPGTFKSPVLTNAATTDAMVLTADKASAEYENFTWKQSDFSGLQLSVDYVVQMDTSAKFKSPKAVTDSYGTSVSVTVEKFNNTALALGVAGFSTKTVYIRLRSIIADYPKDTLYSNMISRTITTYQLSDCGTYCSVGIIGDATPGGWDNDTDMHLADPTRADKYTWTVAVYLIGGKSAKFRAMDAWTNNWGGTDFPSGTGTLNGSNITVPNSGYYQVTFNDQTGAYSFKSLTSTTFTNVSVIGDATAGGWNTDTDLTQSGTDSHVWTGTVTLTSGSLKFRANHVWDTNWGGTSFPSDYGVSGGSNIPATAGTYFVWFNDVTAQYFFGPASNSAAYNAIGIIGSATSGGWNTDTNLTVNPSNSYLWSSVVTLVDGDAKFRANADWTVNWGGSAFPGGIGSVGGPNIPVKGGSYFVTINTLTGEYYFLK